MRTKLVTLFLFVLLVVTVMPAAAGFTPVPGIENLPSEIAISEQFYRIGSDGRSIVFDSASAKRSGVSSLALKLAEETAAFTNELIQAAASGNGNTLSLEGVIVDINKYPTLAAYNAMLAQRRVPIGTLGLSTAQSICGAKEKPVPNYAAPWIRKGPFNTQNAAESQLKNWAYFRAWWVPGGDWTRNQTYQQWICKANNYRDHAGSPYKSGSYWYFMEQNYTGSVPGEPNPVMSTNPANWPYLTWPSYVYWWHGRF